MGSSPVDKSTQQSSSAAATQLSAQQAANAAAAQKTANQTATAQFGTIDPTTGKYSGGTESQFLDPNSLNQTGLTGTYKDQYNSQANTNANTANNSVGTTIQNLNSRGMGATPAGFDADLQRKAYADQAATNSTAYTSMSQKQLSDALTNYWNANSALSAYGTIASSDYHAATLSIRQRLKGLSWDLNYTFSKSIDDASGLQTSGVYGSAFITNALLQHDNRAVSDFDIRHIINMNSIWEIPVGRGKMFLGGSNKVVNGILGGWSLTSIFRYNSGLPVSSPVDVGGWPANWNVRSWAIPIKTIEASPTRGGATPANLFSDPKAAYNSFRSPGPGETGARNILRGVGFVTLDAGLYKSFQMPWNEKHKLQVRWEVFNVSNTQRLQGNADVTNGLDPQFGSPSASFYNFTSIQGTPRVMQFAVRYDF